METQPTKLPPSREVRMQDGVLVGEAETIAYGIYNGDTGSLADSIVALELTIQHKRSKAVEGFVSILRQQLLHGYISTDGLEATLNAWHAGELFGHNLPGVDANGNATAPAE